MSFALVTVLEDGRPVGCLERDGVLYRLADMQVPAEVAGLFENWPRWSHALATAALPKPVPAGLPVLAPLLYPGKILCAGANYFAHCAEMGVKDLRKEAQRLFFFFKPPRNAVVGPGATVRKPIGTQKMDWEIELAAIIGTRARNVSAGDALGHVAAYTVSIDVSARDLNSAPETFYKLDWVAGKGHDTCCPMGPRMIPAEALGDPQDVRLKLWVNGELKQDSSSSDMIFSVAEQISILSRIMTLDPGDVILTGTPAGVGAPKGTFLSVGDVVRAEIEKIGTLEITVIPEG
jgi:2-keto-4-pentenoate hydratase/2-oxohepta-3-ene-1,7-dioic acid hydratase in catechol pathway